MHATAEPHNESKEKSAESNHMNKDYNMGTCGRKSMYMCVRIWRERERERERNHKRKFKDEGYNDKEDGNNKKSAVSKN